MRFFASLLISVGTVLAVAGCATHQVGPVRPVTVDDDVALAKDLINDDLSKFPSADPVTQAAMRNRIVTARMYIADMEYHYYEGRLTREMQDEGLLATAVNLGLTTSATLVPVAQTKTLLSGLATGITGLDKAYNEKELLSNTIQALQTQMRADRKAEASVIFAKMFKDVSSNARIITPIAEYTLPMALSDVDAYYQAGTISSALIGLSKTVANAERNADEAKSQAGPNPGAVSIAKTTAAMIVPAQVNRRPTIIRDVNVPLQSFNPPAPPPSTTRIGLFEQRMSQKDMKRALDILGCIGADLGPAGSPARKALAKFLTDNSKPSSDRITNDVFFNLRDLKADGKQGTCSG
jgi:hypothetical protein